MNQIIYDSRCIDRVREKEIDSSRLTSRQKINIDLPTHPPYLVVIVYLRHMSLN